MYIREGCVKERRRRREGEKKKEKKLEKKKKKKRLERDRVQLQDEKLLFMSRRFISFQSATKRRWGEKVRREGIWMEMSGHVKERKVLHHKFSRGVPVLFRSGAATREPYGWAREFLVSSGGNALPWSHAQGKRYHIAPRAVQNPVQSLHMIPLHTGGRREPQSHIDGWMEGQRRRWRWDKDEQREDGSIKLWRLAMRGA